MTYKRRRGKRRTRAVPVGAGQAGRPVSAVRDVRVGPADPSKGVSGSGFKGPREPGGRAGAIGEGRTDGRTRRPAEPADLGEERPPEKKKARGTRPICSPPRPPGSEWAACPSRDLWARVRVRDRGPREPLLSAAETPGAAGTPRPRVSSLHWSDPGPGFRGGHQGCYYDLCARYGAAPSFSFLGRLACLPGVGFNPRVGPVLTGFGYTICLWDSLSFFV